MKTSQRGIDFIKKHEGCKLVAYRCPAGVLTIGIGHTSAAGIPQVTEGMRITEREAEAILASDLRKFESDILRLVKVSLTQNQFDALVSFVFNIGAAAFARSTMLRMINAVDLAGAAAQFARWNKSNGKVLAGLVRRRAEEAALFSEEARHEMPQDVTQPDDTLKKSRTLIGTGVAGTATLAGELVDEIKGSIEGIMPYASGLKTVFLVLAIASLALIVYARIDDHKKGKR
jgi:lysozyme